MGRDPKVGREVLSSGSPKFSGNIYFSHLFVNWIKILFSSYHNSRSSPLSCQRAKLFKILTSRGNITPTLRELHANPRKCQNVPLNDGPSPCKLISLLCFLTLFISPIQTSSTIFISNWLCCHTITCKIWRPCHQAAGLHSHHYRFVKLTSRHACSKCIRTRFSYVTSFVQDAFCLGVLQMSV